MNKRTAFSIITGKLFEVNDDEVEKLDINQLLLAFPPNKDCKKCYGRFHIGKNLKNGYYAVCPKCAIFCLDMDNMEQRFFKKSSPEETLTTK